jgi:hypothetical protein
MNFRLYNFTSFDCNFQYIHVILKLVTGTSHNVRSVGLEYGVEAWVRMVRTKAPARAVASRMAPFRAPLTRSPV